MIGRDSATSLLESALELRVPFTSLKIESYVATSLLDMSNGQRQIVIIFGIYQSKSHVLRQKYFT